MRDLSKYIVEKDNLMKAATSNFLTDLQGKLEAMNLKFQNSTRVFDNEIEYLMFCRQQIRAVVLKSMVFDIEMDTI